MRACITRDDRIHLKRLRQSKRGTSFHHQNITARYTCTSGEWPQAAVSGVGDPIERHALVKGIYRSTPRENVVRQAG